MSHVVHKNRYGWNIDQNNKRIPLAVMESICGGKGKGSFHWKKVTCEDCLKQKGKYETKYRKYRDN